MIYAADFAAGFVHITPSAPALRPPHMEKMMDTREPTEATGPTRSVGVTRLVSEFSQHLAGIAGFFLVWILACAAADYLLNLGADAYRMFFGFAAGLTGMEVHDKVKARFSR